MSGLEVIRNINFKKDIIKTTKYRYNKVAIDYMDYKNWNLFERRRKTCFVCNKKFEENEKLSLLFDGNKLNTVCCKECALKISRTTREEE